MQVCVILKYKKNLSAVIQSVSQVIKLYTIVNRVSCSPRISDTYSFYMVSKILHYIMHHCWGRYILGMIHYAPTLTIINYSVIFIFLVAVALAAMSSLSDSLLTTLFFYFVNIVQ